MRGFNLFAAFLGVMMLAIAVGFTVYTGTQETQSLREITTQITSVSAESVADLIRQDAHNTVVSSIRRSFQEFFAIHPVEPPEEAWQSEWEFKKWFSERFIDESGLAERIADALAGELLLYQGLPLKGHTVRVVVNRGALARAIEEGATIEIMDDGTFVFIYDTSRLSPTELAALPTIVVDGETTVSVFPPGRWMVPIPLRIVEAYKKARKALDRIEASASEYKLLFGSCSRETTLCALWKWTGTDVEPIYPEKVGERFDVSTSTVGEGTWRAYNLKDACVDMRLYTDGSELNAVLGAEEIPCQHPETTLLALLQHRLNQADVEDVNVYIVPESIKTYKTWRVVAMEEINVSRLVGESFGIPYLDHLINMILKAMDVKDSISIAPCRPSGYLYCALPAEFTVDLVWTDRDPRYTVTGEPPTFTLRVRPWRMNAARTWLEARERRVAETQVQTNTADINYDPAECEKNMLIWCGESLLRNFQSCAQLRGIPINVIDTPTGTSVEFVYCLTHQGEPLCKAKDYIRGLLGAYMSNQLTGEDIRQNWAAIRGAGHLIYQEFNAYVQEHPDDNTAEMCTQMFAHFRDENALCMDPTQNFCERLRWLQNGVPQCDMSDPGVVAQSIFWFHPFSEFAATCMRGE